MLDNFLCPTARDSSHWLHSQQCACCTPALAHVLVCMHACSFSSSSLQNNCASFSPARTQKLQLLHGKKQLSNTSIGESRVSKNCDADLSRVFRRALLLTPCLTRSLVKGAHKDSPGTAERDPRCRARTRTKDAHGEARGNNGSRLVSISRAHLLLVVNLTCKPSHLRFESGARLPLPGQTFSM